MNLHPLFIAFNIPDFNFKLNLLYFYQIFIPASLRDS